MENHFNLPFTSIGLRQKILSFCLFLICFVNQNAALGVDNKSYSNPVKITQIEKDNDYIIKYRASLPNRFKYCSSIHEEKKQPIHRITGAYKTFFNSSGELSEMTVEVEAYPGAWVELGAKYWTKNWWGCHKMSAKVVGMRAASLKAPINFSHLYQEDQKRVILSWDNITDVPESKYKLQIKRTNLDNNNEEVFEVSGGSTSYTDNLNIHPGARFKYQIRTFHSGGYTVSDIPLGTAPERTSSWVDREVNLPQIISDFQVDTRRNSIFFSWDIRNTYFHNKIRLEYKDASNWTLIEELSETTDQLTWVPSFALVPGEIYEFRVRAMEGMSQIQYLKGLGGLSSNGVLSGHIKIANSEKGVPYLPLKIESKENFVSYQYFEFTNYSNDVNKLDNMTPVKEGVVKGFSRSPRKRNKNYGFIFDAWIYLPKDGNYTFYITADNAAKLYVDGNYWATGYENKGMHEGSKSGHFNKGYYPIKVKFFQNSGGHSLSVRYSGPGISKRSIPSSVLFNKRVVERNVETDKEGYFYVDELYYGEEANFDIIPLKDDADIRPDTISRTLSVTDYKQDDVRFDDYSSIPVYGKVLIGDCAIKDATIVFNGEKTETKTEADGSFEYIIQSPDPNLPNTLDIDYKNHTFSGKLNLNLSSDVRNEKNPHIFNDLQKDTLILSVLSGCDKPIADEADVEIFSANEDGDVCKTMSFTLGASGTKTLYLPAAKYKARVTDLRITKDDATENDIANFKQVKQNIISALGELDIDLTQRDTVKNERVEILNQETGEYRVHNDVTAINLVKAEFIYRQDIDIKIESEQWKTPTCTHEIVVDGENQNEDVFVFEQSEEIPVKFKLSEVYDYYRLMKHQCGVDSASIFITDNVSDRKQVEKTIIDGTYHYKVIPGQANINGNWNEARAFQKNLSVSASVPNYSETVYDQKWALITGHKVLEPAFITSEVHLPEMILHDPPGDASYAYLQEDSKISTGYEFTSFVDAGLEIDSKAYIQVLKGPVCLGVGAYAKSKVGGGFTDSKKEQFTTSFNEKITTSKGKGRPGMESDLIIGTGLNFIYSKSKELTFDCLTGPKVDQAFAVSPGFYTRYVLSVLHIKNHVIPTLESLLEEIDSLEKKKESGETLTEKESYLISSKNVYSTSKANWQKILAENEYQIFTGGTQLSESEEEISNITFSGGSAYDYFSSQDTTKSSKNAKFYKVSASLGPTLKVGDKDAKYNVLELKIGAYVNLKGTHTDSEKSVHKFKQGFHLEDKSVGDFFTVDITKDPNYGTYLFKTVSGRSSCPTEPGTQTRDRAKITVVSNPELYNLPKGKKAVYKFRIDNDSQSEEGRLYSVNTLTGQQDGTSIYLGANKVQPIGKNYPLFIEHGKTNELILTVKPGPKTKSLPIKLIVTPDCMTSLYKSEDLLKVIEKEMEKEPCNVSTLELFASWESDCDPIKIESPADNWIVNTHLDAELPLTISGFNPNSKELSSLEIQYRKSGDFDWNRLMYISSENIGDFPRRHLNIQVDTLDAGKYFIRAKTYCADLGVENYSEVISGRIDHNPFVPIGNNLSNGWLKEEYFKLDFTKQLAQAKVKIERFNQAESAIEHTSYIDAVIWDNSAVIEIPQANQYEGRKFKLTFEQGNVISDSGDLLSSDKTYTFKLEKAGAAWEYANKVVVVVKGQTTEFSANLINKGIEDVQYEIVSNSLSAYVTPQFNTGTIPANGLFPVLFEVNQEGDIPLGTLNGEVAVDLTMGTRAIRKILQLEMRVKDVAPNWVDVDNRAYNMRMVAQFTPSSAADIPLSRDERDKIAAFIDGELVGFSKIYFDNSANKYLAFLTIESDKLDANVSFKMWDASENMIYSAKEEIKFVEGSLKGAYNDPFILHAKGAEQSIRLHKGWNFISLNVIPDNLNIASVFGGLKQPNTQIKHIHDGFCEFEPQSQSWNGALSAISVDKAYKVYVEQDDIFRVSGQLINSIHSIPLSQYSLDKYNWLAMHNNSGIDLEYALDNEELIGGEVISHNNRFAVLSENRDSWSGNLTILEPGKGYELYHPGVMNLNPDIKIRLKADAELTSTIDSELTVHIVLGGDTLGAYEPHRLGGIPNARHNHSFEIGGELGNSVSTILDFDEAGISPHEFVNNHLQFFVRSGAYKAEENIENHTPVEVDFNNIVLEVLGENDQIIHQYDYSKLMNEIVLGEYFHNWGNTNNEFQFRKQFVRKESHLLLLEETSPYKISGVKSGSQNILYEEEAHPINSLAYKEGPHTMTLVSQVYLNGIQIDADNFTLEVMLDDDVLARNYLDVQNELFDSKQMLMLRGNSEDDNSLLSFRLVDHRNDTTYLANQELPLRNDVVVGNLSSPYRIDFENQEQNVGDLKVWPNPIVAGDLVNVYYNKEVNEFGEIKIQVFDVNGKVIYSEVKTDNVHEIPTHSFKPGVYVITLSENGKLKSTAKLIVN